MEYFINPGIARIMVIEVPIFENPLYYFVFVFSTYPAAQLPLAVPDLLAHSVEV